MDGKTTGVRTFDLAQTVSGFLQGTIADWPASIQDPIYAALERAAVKHQIPVTIVMSRCDIDHDVPEGRPGRFYIHVIASEIVMADERTLAPGTVIRQLPEDVRRLLN